jgi:hypothetical protein
MKTTTQNRIVSKDKYVVQLGIRLSLFLVFTLGIAGWATVLTEISPPVTLAAGMVCGGAYSTQTSV